MSNITPGHVRVSGCERDLSNRRARNRLRFRLSTNHLIRHLNPALVRVVGQCPVNHSAEKTTPETANPARSGAAYRRSREISVTWQSRDSPKSAPQSSENPVFAKGRACADFTALPGGLRCQPERRTYVSQHPDRRISGL